MPELISSPSQTITIPGYEYSAQELALIEAKVTEFESKRRLGLLVNAAELDSYYQFYSRHRNADKFSIILTVMYPTDKWQMQGEDLSTLVWDDNNPNPKPTAEELNAHRPKVQDFLLQEEYIKKRAMAYPPEALLTRALWEWLVEGKPHLKDCVQQMRLAVKAAFPKPINPHPLIASEEIMKNVPVSPSEFDAAVEKYLEEVAALAGQTVVTPPTV